MVGRARCTASSAPTARARPPPSGSCSGCCAPTPATSACSAATPGATPSRCTAGSPTCPATSPCGPTSPAARSIDLLGRLRGGLDRAPARRAARALRPRPAQEGPHLLQGQPAEGRARRRARLRRRAAAPRRADLRARPADGGGLPATASTRSATRGGTVLLSSHILAEVEALCDRVSIIRAGRTRRDRHAGRAAPPDPHVDHGRAGAARPRGWRRLPGVHDLRVDGNRVALRGRHRRARRRLLDVLRRAGVRGADQPAADARGAVPAPLRRRPLPSGPSSGRSRGPRRDDRCRRRFLRHFLRRDRWMLLWWTIGVVLLYGHAGRQRRRALHEPGRVRPGRGDHGGQRRLRRHGRPGPGAEHDRRPGHLAGHARSARSSPG